MDLAEAKELFADILISFQRGEIDLPEALVAVRDLEIPEVEEPELPDEGEDPPVEPETPPEPEQTPEEIATAEAAEKEAIEAASAELDEALALIDNAR